MVNRRIVIIGATSAMAEQCARLWLEQSPTEVVLVGRNADRLARTAQDLRVRQPSAPVRTVVTNMQAPEAIASVVDEIFATGPVDIALIAHGLLPDQERCQTDLSRCREALLVNGLSPALFAEAFAGHMERAGQGRLGVIGSVAGDRGRKKNYVYGAGKGLLSRYVQGLQHRLAGTGVAVTLILPGPTATPMTAHLQGGNAATSLAAVDKVALAIVAAMEKGRPVCYVPAKWAIVMMVLRHLPRAIFNKLDI